MIYELSKKDFIKVRGIQGCNQINLEIDSVISGYNPGWIFVDNIDSPRTAMIWSQGIEGFYFIGDENNEDFNRYINEYIDSTIKKRSKAQGLKSFEFSGTSPAWDGTFKQIFSNRDMLMSKQFVYKNTLDMHNQYPMDKLKDNYVIRIVNKELLENENYKLSLVKSSILSWWDSIEDYYKYGLGVCITDNDEAVCSCVTSFRAGDTIESHIITAKDYRRKGLATLAVGKFIREAKKSGFNLYWDCMEKNYGSRALAEKHNYNKAFEYKLYEFNF